LADPPTGGRSQEAEGMGHIAKNFKNKEKTTKMANSQQLKAKSY
jgi:hypothetical protein